MAFRFGDAVIDDGSTDAGFGVAQACFASHPEIDVTMLLNNSPSGVGLLNTIAKFASGEIIIEADCDFKSLDIMFLRLNFLEAQHVEVCFAGFQWTEATMVEEQIVMNLPVPDHLHRRPLAVLISTPEACAPADLDVSDDTSQLCVGLCWIKARR